MSLDAQYRISATVKHPPLIDNQRILICRSCHRIPPNIVENFRDGDLVCGDCGVVFPGRIIDERSEWRTFDNEDGDDPSRVGQAYNPFLDGTQLDTLISRRDGGSGVSRVLAKAHGKASANKGERDLIEAYKEIAAMCDHARLSKSVADAAKHAYKIAHDKRLFAKLNSHTVVVAACIFLGCRYAKVPRTFKEICALTRVGKKELGRTFKILAAHVMEQLGQQMESLDARQLLSRFCAKLNLPQVISKAAAAAANRADEMRTVEGRSPVSVAAACIYFTAPLFGAPRSPRQISEVSGVSEPTIRGTYKQLWQDREELVGVIKAASANSGSTAPVTAHGGVESLPAP